MQKFGLVYHYDSEKQRLTVSESGIAILNGTEAPKLSTEDNLGSAVKLLLGKHRIDDERFAFVLRMNPKPSFVDNLGEGLLQFFMGEVSYLAWLDEDLTESELAVTELLAKKYNVVRSFGKGRLDNGLLEF